METHSLLGQTLRLHPLKGVYWEDRQTLLLADLHLGKGAHFRRAGIPVPRAVADVNLERMETMIRVFSPQRLLLLGDLFHSDHNHVWTMFCDFMDEFPDVAFELVPGNHDILPAYVYERCRLRMREAVVTEGPFSFSHHPLEKDQRIVGKYNFCGHVHPCVHLADRAGNGMKLPCFFFGTHECILPAFGQFTGCHRVEVRSEDRVFVLAEDAVVGVS